MGKMPAEHLALLVGAFRIITFWIRIPIGWLALVATNRAFARTDHKNALPSPR
jgi:hypothetical protein